MALHHAQSGEIIELLHPRQAPEDLSTALLKTDDIEVIRRVLYAGQTVPRHEVNGDITVQCLLGAVKLNAHDKSQTLMPGELVYIAACEPYSLEANEASAVLMTIVRSRFSENSEWRRDESFDTQAQQKSAQCRPGQSSTQSPPLQAEAGMQSAASLSQSPDDQTVAEEQSFDQQSDQARRVGQMPENAGPGANPSAAMAKTLQPK
jgi:quercetin dioxygenase-like cupin family protein